MRGALLAMVWLLPAALHPKVSEGAFESSISLGTAISPSAHQTSSCLSAEAESSDWERAFTPAQKNGTALLEGTEP